MTAGHPVDDIEIAYWRIGTGIPLVAVGDPRLGHRYMRALDAWTSEGFELIYFDARVSDPGAMSLGQSTSLSGAS